MTDLPLDFSPEVAEARASGRPLVALESTIIAHGMAYPANLDTARRVEAIIREKGAVPATIAVLGGRLKVGLGDADLERLATAKNVMKASTRELPLALATRRDAATTVASTMRIAALAGIAVFATGGIGGVHRGAPATFDISADLTELARTPVAVVSAGAKAILDLGLTLETLETLGVPVICVGTDAFPAFYSRDSGLAAPARLDTAGEIAALLAAQRRLGLEAGALVANPIPAAAEIPAPEIEPVITAALAEAAARGIAGKDVTPFLLARVAVATEGRSLKANIALVENNARLGAEIAAAYAALT
ncbi:pseudouridine-5'-phosphate glycosidase [Chelatococcus sp. SYSU_G07232]|uniref:Pseudouridine-5'-phosphate glycosidase n=1 Tax=Chelatococcus albus TaxID=3047466 RepID=A0ABT7ADA6_9HYPH|nr:pseudouridine-5'-phosphate glycosidase [Chelatococcus sp. SYSU_G07232]MDJ1157368.1 pseudouridine-5'-phosphate glycosidase [Chelatococcus sp. SYSU_G07232]